MSRAGLAMGLEVRELIERMLANPRAHYLHVHNAMHGCYAARVDRV